jgi:TonB family protein
MPQTILVVEHEQRYIERIKQAVAGQSLDLRFVPDDAAALMAIGISNPALIVLSSPHLIQAIRERHPLQPAPILFTPSDYRGTTPKEDAAGFGASDLLPKPYSESQFLGKVQQMLGLPQRGREFTARPAAVPAFAGEQNQLTSNEIFGDLLHDESAARSAARKPSNSKDDLDKLLEDTLSGVLPKKKKDGTSPGITPKPAEVKPKTQPGSKDIDRILSSLAPSRPKTSAGTTPLPPRPGFTGETVTISQPVLPKAAAPPPVEEPEPTDGVRFGQYVLLEKIASGGMAEVWKARMRGVEGFQKIVAIKKILPHLSDNQEFIEMFIDEAKLAAQLNHNNIIHIYDLGKIQSSYYIAMEYVDGSDLKTILQRAEERGQPLTVELAMFIASKIAAALDYAHRKRDFENQEMGLVHRDVSPQNVLISQEGDIKLCDFGIAKAASKASHTQAGALKGKLQYMSPEQAWGRSIDRRSDVFALAAVLFETLTGRKLFTGENEISILEQVREARVVPPSQFNEEVTPEIDRIVLKALERDPANRYQSAGEMARDIDSVLYEIKPTPTSADLAIYMHRLSTAPPIPAAVPEPAPEPEPMTERDLKALAPLPAATLTAPEVAMPAWDARRSEEKKRAPMGLIAVAALFVVAAVVAGLFYFRRQASSAAPVAVASNTTARPVVEPPAPSAASATVATAATETLAPAPITASTAEPVLDAAKVAQEVQKRLAAEKARLEQQARAQQVQPPPVVQRAAPPPPVPQPVPQPVIVENRPAVQPPPQAVPQPVAPQPVAAQPVPQPQPQPAAETPRVREGDLVPAETEGLVMARMIRRAPVPYPLIAKAQRVEGTVLVSALISETGKVLDVKIIRPFPRPVGLNEAAEQIVRRSTFSPPTKDGVRVKAWTPVPVDFKL